jgi:carbamoyltransferase
MGLAPYGEPRFSDLIQRELIDLREDGSFHLNMKYFRYHFGLTMTGKRFERLLGEPRREPEGPLTQFHKDVAASIQKVTDRVVVTMARSLQKRTGQKQLCMAGGVALNCVSNSKILEETDFDDVFVQPAAGDAGGAVGAAYYLYNTILGHPRTHRLEHVFLGPEFSDQEVEPFLRSHNIRFEQYGREALLQVTARAIADQKVVGWFQGRMEFGPRSLGSRSILADARNPENQSVVNLKIKFRESFRPFAPTVLAERTGDYFLWGRESPYMLFVATVREDRRSIPAVTHVDGSARLQTIARDQHPLYYDLIAEFDRQTGCPVIINTSFNVRGEPIVCTPRDAWRCFMRTEMDVLVLGSYVLRKEMMDRSAFIDDQTIELD